ncbi:carbohydrate ABC transporter permease [Paenibacillus validus]|uniref:ABC transporter permease subunit n=1 Tax=Paenibacillus validus TaxID=44253 RepID=A0A7X2ZC58_9BACL|nr:MULTISPECIES: carbohydrate ABC transporter permease [Paenibacillus]MED4603988.1 carbohydrate ABC transporter permease [Paenibacillus validus]MED4609334.1 carbohydrate ABC transporter permease [Paenibacillus validus]MUG72139.1 ABC transporter permease subunit [Paenibacillus validus]
MIQRVFHRLLSYGLLSAAAAVVIFPIAYTFSASMMTDSESVAYPPRLLPSGLNLANFTEALALIPVGSFILNSFLVSSAIMIGQLLTASLAAYAFAYLRFYGKALLFTLFLSTMMIPWEVTIIPNYLTVKSWGWLDTYQALIVPFLATAFGTFLLRQWFLQLPKELFEAAKIDGCGHLRSFAMLVLPLSKPALATLGVYSFLTHWNMYLWPLLVTNGVERRTVQIGISMLQFEEMTSWNLVLAGVVMVLLPSLLLLALGLKQLVGGMTAGALKG